MNYDFELQHFKAFPTTGTIPLRPLTLIFGPNSSGKSSLLQSLLLLKQTLDESETPETLLLPKGNLVDLGGYREFVHRHETERPFSIRLMQSGDLDETSTNSGPDLRRALNIKRFGLQITFGYDEAAANATVREFAFYVDDPATPFCTFRQRPIEDLVPDQADATVPLRLRRPGVAFFGAEANAEHPLWTTLANFEQDLTKRTVGPDLHESLAVLKRRMKDLQDIEEAAKAGTKPKRGKRQKRRGAPLDKDALGKQIELLEQELQLTDRSIDAATQSLIERHSRTYFVARNFLPGDIAVTPERGQRQASGQPAMDRHFILNFLHGSGATAAIYGQVAQMLRSFLDELVYLGPLRESPERHYVFSGNVTGQVGKTGRLVPDVLFKNRSLLQTVNEQLAAFEVGYDLVITGTPTGELNDVFSLRLVDRTTKVNASILDVGFGISQVLPVIVQSMLSRNKTVCIEQPEIHLHPRLQAELGSLLAGCIGAPYKNRFIIETHSQHLMLRVQKLIRRGDLKSSDVSVIYVDKDSSGSACLELRLDERGEFIDQWPHGFFEEGYEEMFAQ